VPNAPPDTPFRLAEFLIRPALYEIEGPEGTARINPKAMEVLVALAERPEDVCTKQKILDTVWTDLFVGDEVLSTAVWELRRALGDSARSPRFIQTVPRKGYRLLMQPSPVDLEIPSASQPTTGIPSRKVLLIAVAGVVAACVAAAVFMLTGVGGSENATTEIGSLVVLPIEDLGDDPRDQALADGLTDTLITSLAGIDGLRVVSRTTSLTYRDRGITTSEVAAELGVDAVVEGTLSRAGDRIVLNAQLIDARNENHLWAETYERRFENLLDLQVEVARSIGAAISARIEPAITAPVAILAEDNPDGSLLRWRFRTGGEIWSTPVAVADAVVFGSRDGVLYSVAVADGSERWRLRVGTEVLTRALVIDDTVFAASFDGTIIAATARDGIERWRVHIGGEIKSHLTGEKGLVIAADQGGRVIALDAWSGRQLWAWSGGGGVDGLACGEGAVIASGFDGSVTVLDAIDGEKRWEVTVAEWLGQPVTIDHQQVLVPSTDGHVIALDLEDGSELWRSTAPAPSEITAWRDRIFVGGEGTVIRAMERNSGNELWRFDALGATTAPSVQGEIVFVGSQDNNLYALDAWTGTLLWRDEMRTWVTTAAISQGNVHIFGSLDGSIVCLDAPDSPSVVIREINGFMAEPEERDERPREFDIIVSADGSNRPRVRWRFLSDGPVLHTPAFTDSLVLASGYETLTAVDLDSGEAQWVNRLPGEAGTQPVPVGDSVVVGTRDGYVVAFGLKTGEERWRFATGGAVISTPTLGPMALFFGSRDGFLYSLDPETGREHWRRQLDTIHSSPLILDDELWVTGRSDTVWILAAEDGRVLRTAPTADWAVADPVAWRDRVIIASCDGTVAALARPDGREFWRVTNPGDIWFRPLIHDNRYFFGSADHHAYALDAATGRELWRRRTENRVLSSVACWRNLVFVGSDDRSLHALSADKGEPQWRLATTGAVANPAVKDDLLAVGSFDGYLYLLELD